MSSDEVNAAMVAACQRLDAKGSFTRAEWARENRSIVALYEQLSEEDRAAVDLEPLAMMQLRARSR